MPKFPFTNYHELNLDWILKKVNALFDASEENAQTIRTYNTRLTAAEQTATNANTAATAAQQLAYAASENADDALAVAGTADSKADSALTAATTAVGAAAGAMTTAQEARQIAGSAQSAAADAGAVANDASNAAAAAQQTADTNAGNIANLQTAVDTLSSSVTEIDNKADVIIDSASGSIASFADGANDMSIRSLVVNIEPVQAGSGDPSPENIRPITGHTECSVVRTGKNILNSGAVSSSNGLTITKNNDGVITVTGTPNKTWVNFNSPYNVNIPKGTYKFSVGVALPFNFIIYYYYEGENTQNFVSLNANVYERPITFSKNVSRIFIGLSGMNTNTNYNTILKPQLEVGSSATAFEPYTATTASVSWQSAAGTVYGGTLDVTNGVLTVDRAMIDMGTLTWNWSSSDRFFDTMSIASEIKKPANNNVIGDILCSEYKSATNEETYSKLVDSSISVATTGRIRVYSSQFDGTGSTNVLQGIQLVYGIANPITYQLTSEQISGILSTLYGTNNIWSDVGTVDVEYPADTKLYIDGKIAELQALVLEN